MEWGFIGVDIEEQRRTRKIGNWTSMKVTPSPKPLFIYLNRENLEFIDYKYYLR